MTLVDGVMIYLWFVIARSDSDEAIQSHISDLNCFAELVIGPATSGRTRWLAMTRKLTKFKDTTL
jgi:hypothetical protein